MHTAESNFSNFVIENLGEIETEFENTLACLSAFRAVFRVRIQLNPDPDPVINLNPDSESLESGSGSKIFLTLPEKKLKLPVLHNFKIFSSKEVN